MHRAHLFASALATDRVRANVPQRLRLARLALVRLATCHHTTAQDVRDRFLPSSRFRCEHPMPRGISMRSRLASARASGLCARCSPCAVARFWVSCRAAVGFTTRCGLRWAGSSDRREAFSSLRRLASRISDASVDSPRNSRLAKRRLTHQRIQDRFVQPLREE